ncbi:MAG: Gfo/Idh/MocA family oxidoreductase, partial [Clostridia bacterium]|nr:Gfo/Idh/MocA family oxidoreductase [Clostridia bacterium]
YALSKGKDVFLEKPMTVTLSEAKELVDTANRLNRKVMLHQQHRIFDSTIALLEGLSRNLIGDIFRVNYNISGYTVRNDWQALKKYGGGMLYNYGAHFVDLFLYVFNPTVTKVFCKTDKILSVGDAEDVVKIILETRENITYDLDINMASTVKHPKWIVYGKKGTITINDSSMMIKYLKDDQALKLQLQSTLAAENRKYDNTGALEWAELEFPLSSYPDISYYDKVYEYFALNQLPLVPLEQSLKVMEILAKCDNQ